MVKSILRFLIGILLAATLGYFGYRGYQDYLAPAQPTATPAPVQAELDDEAEVISAEGKIVPRQSARLSFNIAGVVKTVNVAEGELVQAGEVIAALEGSEQLEAALAAAQMELISAEQALEELMSLAPLQTAEAQQELAYAQSALDETQHRWESFQEGNRATSETIQMTEESLEEAERAVENAQAEYDQFSGASANDPERILAYSRLLIAKQVRDRVRSQLNWYQGSPSEIDRAILDAELALAEQRLMEAERQWELVKDGPDQDKVTLAEAQVDSAKTQVAAAQASLEDLQLLAPFTGTVTTLNLKAGELISPAVLAVVLADISQWQVETVDLTENDIPAIFTGMEAIITMNAYPEKEFHGVVTKIGLQGEESRGSVTYAVLIDFDPEEAEVRWGMTAFVDFHLK